MNKLIMTLVGAFALMSIAVAAQAAPASSLPRLTAEKSAVEQVYCRRYRICRGYGYNRHCHWVRRCH